MNTIQLKDLSIGYKLHNGKTKTIASHINASVESGMLTCLIGRNGTGKSTLLRTMTGFIPPLEGQVILEGRDLSMLSATERARIISIVLTERPETDNITVNELVGMGRLPYTNFWGTLQEEDRQIVDDAMQMIGIYELRNRKIGTLSDGEKQKAMIGKAIAQQTPVIILDEPTAFLDYPSKQETMLLLHQLAQELNKTIFLSTHDLNIAYQVADKIWCMGNDDGLRIGDEEIDYFIAP
ncbi:MAG: ABC transporter ATP-binding protein [Prevotella sp.]|jgi:iron complex transport system ATP-binding protein|nr:ABC transporter ATP-binding protein [Prevotella sp.]